MKKYITLRQYQTRIVDAAIAANTIVVLPTGAGKTLIGGEVIKRVGTPALFLVPTILLVGQQQAALQQWTNLNVCPYQGGVSLPASFDILVSTPKAFEIAQENSGRNPHLQWPNFKTIVFDEVHHVLKEHPYRKLALSLQSSGATPRVVGLTASFTYAVGEEKSKAALQKMCDELSITRLETAPEKELRACGYHALDVHAEVSESSISADVPHGVLPTQQRLPHLMLDTFFARLEKSETTPFAALLAKCALRMEAAVAELDRDFRPPMQSREPVKKWGVKAHRFASIRKDGRALLYRDLEHWYEALRLLIVSWEEDEFAAVHLLRLAKCDDPVSIRRWPGHVANGIEEFWKFAPTKFPRLEQLRKVLIEKRNQLKDFRGLVFVQQRVATHIIEHFIGTDDELGGLFKVSCLYATSSPATPSFRVTKSEAKKRVEKFASGEVNLLITTVVAEEGMDIPAANCVIRFDAMNHAVSLVQGRGRARQAESAFVVLKERSDRTHEMLAATEKQHLELVRTFQPGQNDKMVMMMMRDEENADGTESSSAAKELLGEVDSGNAVMQLHEFCQKTGGKIESVYQERGGRFAVRLGYRSEICAVTSVGVGRSKKVASAEAALEMISALRKQLGRD